MVNLITSTANLKSFCAKAAKKNYITVDTEFLRERTYFSKLCLIQIAYRGDDVSDSALIDVQSKNINLNPFYELLQNENVLKVFHAARQDLEIFFLEKKIFPKPFFDTQVAAMVCGFGDQVGYETLVKKLALITLDKSSRFTNWSQRPLSNNQLSYAIADVTHLRTVYEELSALLEHNERSEWLDEELAILLDPKTYDNNPENAWKRIKTKNNNLVFLSFVKSLANFREKLAQSKNIPRNRVLRDEMIIELASIQPKSLTDLRKSRLLKPDNKKGIIGEGILAAIKKPILLNEEEIKKHTFVEVKKLQSNGLPELLRVLLKANSEKWGVAQKLIASSADLDDLASLDSPEISVLTGWRKKVFGNDALKLKSGEIALSSKNGSLKIIDLKKK
ncbi:MAG: ribonuclease D [Paracoccaceae bacterium]|nr:ribonuclease D [Paracoccaceae bacterium]